MVELRLHFGSDQIDMISKILDTHEGKPSYEITKSENYALFHIKFDNVNDVYLFGYMQGSHKF